MQVEDHIPTNSTGKTEHFLAIVTLGSGATTSELPVMCLVLLNHQTLVSFNTCPTVASLVDCQNASKCNLQEHWCNKTSTNTGPGITKKAAKHSTTGANCLLRMKNAKNFFIESMNKNPHLCNSSPYSKWWNWQDLTQKASPSFRFSPPKLWFQTLCRYQNTQGAQKTQSVIQVRYPGKKQTKEPANSHNTNLSCKGPPMHKSSCSSNTKHTWPLNGTEASTRSNALCLSVVTSTR